MTSVFRRVSALLFLTVFLTGLLTGCGWNRRAEGERAPTYILVFEDREPSRDHRLLLPGNVEELLEGIDVSAASRVIVIYE